MGRAANYKNGVVPTCSCPDPWTCTKRAPHRTWSWRISKFITNDSGRRYRPSGAGLPSESAAIDARNDAMADYRARRRVDDGGSTIRDLFTWWLEAKEMRRPKLSTNTLNGYRREAEEWCRHIGTVTADSLTYGHVNAAIEVMGQRRDTHDRPAGYHGRWVERLSIEALKRRHSVLRNMLNFALLHGKVSKNVAAGRMTAIGESLTADLEEEDAWTEHLPQDSFETRWEPTQTAEFLDSLVGHKWEALYTQYVYTAARRAEWLGAHREALKDGGLRIVGTVRIVSRKDAAEGKGVCPVCKIQHRGRVLVRRTKNLTTKKGKVKTRRVPVPVEGMELLNRHLVEQAEHRRKMGAAYVDHYLIFAEDDGSPILPGAVTKEFQRLVAAAGLPPIRLHDLRHNAASLFLAAGIQPVVVAKMTGHDPVVLQEIYHHLSPELTDEMFQRANDTVTRLRGHSGQRAVRSLETVRPPIAEAG